MKLNEGFILFSFVMIFIKKRVILLPILVCFSKINKKEICVHNETDYQRR